MFKGKSWFTSWTNSKPKNPHSIDHLKYLYNVMAKNQVVSEANKTLLVETLRSISEILIWGDQNDSTVFDFFLEKNMLSFFLEIMAQKCGSYVCVQLLQTLNILFENIRNETSIYYLLSNNHVNSIIVHKFDFSDEEVMAYYISFLKTLSLKLNTHTIHFFFNENTNDFPLYTEAIKFFHHPEKMVRIAVRTLTLNVFKVKEKSMLKFVTDRTAAPYFSNLVWFIGNHVLEIDSCLRKQIKDQQMLIRLDDLVAEHLDHLHYLNDILLLRIDDLNEILTDHLLNRLLIPLYIYSLITPPTPDESSNRPRISQIVSLFLVSQVFLIISYDSLVQKLVDILLNGKMSIFEKPEFSAPPETLEESLVQAIRLPSEISNNIVGSHDVNDTEPDSKLSTRSISLDHVMNETKVTEEMNQDYEATLNSISDSVVNETSMTDEEKAAVVMTKKKSGCKEERPFLSALLDSLDCRNQSDDHSAIFSLCLIYAMVHNSGVNKSHLYDLIIPNPKSSEVFEENLGSTTIVNILIEIIHICCQYNSRIRLITLEMCIILLKRLIMIDGKSILPDQQLASVEQSKEEAALVLRNFFKSEEEDLFLDMFEDENQEMMKRHLNVEYLMMDANLLLPPSQLTPLLMDGLELSRRLPCADVERTRYAIRVFLLLRQFSNTLRNVETPTIFPTPDNLVVVDQSLDLNHGDLIACTVITKDQPKVRRFMVIDSHQLILAEPDVKLIGWGIAKSVAFLQDVDINPDKDDSRSLLINIRQSNGQNKRAVITARFVFDDHIRCMAAKQRLTKGKMKAQQRALIQIAKLIDLQPITDLSSKKKSLSRKDFPRSQSQSEGISTKKHLSHGLSRNHRTASRGSAVPGFAVSDKGKPDVSRAAGPFHHHHHIKPPGSRRRSGSHANTNASSTAVSPAQEVNSRESSPKPNSSLESSEEMIPLDDLSTKPSRRPSRPFEGKGDQSGNVTSLSNAHESS